MATKLQNVKMNKYAHYVQENMIGKTVQVKRKSV